MPTPPRLASAHPTIASITSSLVVELRRLARSGLGLGVLVAFAFFGLSSPALAIYMPEILGAAASSDQLTISASQATPADAVSLFNQSAMQLGLIVTVAVAITSVGWDTRPGSSIFYRTRVRRLSTVLLPRLAHRMGNVLVRPAPHRRRDCRCDRTSPLCHGGQDVGGLWTLHRHGDEYRPPACGRSASNDDGHCPDHPPGPRPAGDEPGTGNVPSASHRAAPADGAACDAGDRGPGRHRTVLRRKRPHRRTTDAQARCLTGLVGQNDLDGWQTPRCLPPICANHQFGYLTGAAGGFR